MSYALTVVSITDPLPDEHSCHDPVVGADVHVCMMSFCQCVHGPVQSVYGKVQYLLTTVA